MLITTQDTLSDYTIDRTLGLVRGSTVRARHVGRDILAALRNIVGGEIKEYTRMLDEAREQALERMLREAAGQGADAVVGVRFVTAPVMEGAAEILVYGTAVRLTQKP
jgi:uncharacterized protein YbjQ (UPF0145 family)